MITPSSNTVVEPVTNAVTLPLYPRVTVHYTRIEVTSVSLDAASLAHFSDEPMLRAAGLLADAGVDAIVWNGTAGSWRGVEQDRRLCDAIETRTGIAASTSTLALVAAFAALGVSRLGLAVPYTDPVREAIHRVYAEIGCPCVGSAGLDITVNRAFADVPPDDLRQLVRRSDSPAADAIAIVCTNLATAWLVEELETDLRKPVLDSTLVTIWHALRMVGLDDPIAGWGRLRANDSRALVP